jgi:subtilisin family serine protease
MSELKKYIVTLHNHEDLDAFYEDMETPGGNLYIPDRAVDLVARRPNSRNTHYLLTDAEAEQIKNDPRVWNVELEEMVTRSRRPMYTQTSSDWNKSWTENSNHRNWGLLRCFEAAQRSNWGSDGTVGQTGTITINTEGRNVDVVIVDGHINPAHPEFAVNSDGTGGSRVNQYNWYQHTNAITGNSNGTYVYTPYVDGNSTLTDDNNHGCHVAGTVAGNQQGWARRANIYNISPYGSNSNSLAVDYLYDYIKEFHLNKSVNPATGRKNPTILNCSFGNELQWNYTDSGGNVWGPVERITYQGVQFNRTGGLTVQEMTDRGLYTTNTSPVIPYYSTSDEADINDLINMGVVIVAAAGNRSFYTCNSTDTNANNTYRAALNGFYYTLYLHRGTAPAAIANVISVGAVGNTLNETKATYSNTGPGVDIFAPGTAIVSSLNSGSTTDPRNASYYIGKYQGTSMASPQVCGVLACALEAYPTLNQLQAREYLIATAKTAQMTDTGGSFTDVTSLNGASNRYLAFRQEKNSQGQLFPRTNYWVRPSSGAVYPRSRIRRI